jgi:hypothetical protein
MKLRFLTMLLLLLAILFVACKKDDGSKSGIVARVVASEGNVTGAVVKLYNIPDLANPSADASVWSVTESKTQVGFKFDVRYGFDHRIYNPIKVDTVDGDGEINFESVVAGDYYIVAEIPNVVWSLPKKVQSSGGDVDVGELVLPRVVDFGESTFSFTSDTTFRAGTHYILRNNTTVRPDVTLTIEPGAVVRLYSGKSLEVRGTLVCRGTPDQFIMFLPNDVINRAPDSWLQVKFRNTAVPPNIAYTVFRHGSTGIDLETNGGIVEYCHFHKFSGEGILARYEPPLIRHCIFERNGYGIYNTATDGLTCENNIFQSCDPFAMWLNNKTGCDVNCNWFRDCGGSDTSGSGARGVIKLDLVSDSEIRNNHFETSWYAFQVGSWVDSTTEIHHNTFNRMNTVMNVSVTEEQRGPSNPRFNYNCFTNIDRHIVFYNCSQHNYLDMDATNNFWSTTSVSYINEHYINDRLDNPTCPVVNFAPVMISCAEIQNETGTAAGICP